MLVRLLVALPVGAVAGGWLTHRMPAGIVTAAGMAAATTGFAADGQWDMESLRELDRHGRRWCWPGSASGWPWPRSTPLCSSATAGRRARGGQRPAGRGAHGRDAGRHQRADHPRACARYYAEQTDLPTPMEVCGEGVSRCAEFSPDPAGGGADPAPDRLRGRRASAAPSPASSLWSSSGTPTPGRCRTSAFEAVGG